MGKFRPTVNICTDCGVLDNVGSWAAVIARSDGRGGIVEASGIIRRRGVDTFAGEASAVANGLHVARREGLIGPSDRVAVRCDNLGLVKVFRGEAKLKARRNDVREAVRAAKAIAKDVGCKLRVSHIKGKVSLSGGDELYILHARADHLCCVQTSNSRVRSSEVGVSDFSIEELSKSRERIYRAQRSQDIAAQLMGKK